MAGNISAPGQARWSSKAAFVLAATGSAVGLGNLWRFPTEAGSNGGGAFVLLYILCVVLIAMPLLLAESLIGRHGQRSTIASAAYLARQSRASPMWSVLAVIGMLANTAILTFYCVVAGWVVYFIGTSAVDLIGALSAGEPLRGAYGPQSVEQIQQMMPTLFANPVLLVGLQLAFVVVTVWIVARGVKGGIEVAATWLMPAFFFLLIGITVYAAIIGDFAAALTFLFTPDFERALHPGVLSSALGQAFFSLSLGGGAMIAYGAYASRDTNLAQTSGMIAFADTAVAVIAGLAIFPIVFSVGMEPNAGPTLMFQTLPAAFHAMPGGAIVGLAFFVLALFAALTSSVSLLEISVGWVTEKFGVSRVKASVWIGVLVFLVGLLSALSFNVLADQRPLAFVQGFENATWFDAIDGVTGRLLLPLSGLITAIFIGWVADRQLVNAETGLKGGGLAAWRFLIAWLCPLAVAAILVIGLFPQLLG
ncbi:MAG: sodium-dependent transporter [Brevundimonas sp.]|uniref:sodium-dependent transporter n=1 Tax=Brevundimonas sp. TaxID=1871086 RepID=UPI0026379EDF|nr:sodium-dependent transporter [Brevundimonas sp.]MDI6624242.1 sodium-dependent transporter [Brevundimonas sp.]MDQ7812492.1 sodium-dependent transporter [Brevundimonas sp.]